MPIKQNISVNLTSENILRRQGILQRPPRPEIAALTEELLSEVHETCLLEPVAAYNIYPITEVSDDRMSLSGGAEIRSTSLPVFLLSCRDLAVAVCTIGPRLEQRVTDFFDGGEALCGLLLDGIGSAAVDSLAQETCKLVQNEASLRGYQASSPCSPGSPSFPITEQWTLFQLVPAAEIGVSLAASGIMVPRKSASMVIALGNQVTIRERGEACTRCNLSKTCHYKLVVN
jgi:hypothetical protein